MEHIVRPFQTTTTIVDRQFAVTKPTKVSNQKAILVWGGPGQAPTIGGGLNFIVKDPDNKFTEKSRRTTDHRVQNPDDSSQFIVAQEINSIVFEKLASSASQLNKAFAESPTMGPSANPLSTPSVPAPSKNEISSYNLSQDQP